MIRQPASENSFTVACPMPREAPVSTMVFCSTDGRSMCGGAPGYGQSTVFSSADPCSDRRSGSAIARINSQDRAAPFATRSVVRFSDIGGFARSGPTRRDPAFRRRGCRIGSSCEPILGAEAGACRSSDTARPIRYKVRRRRHVASSPVTRGNERPDWSGSCTAVSGGSFRFSGRSPSEAVASSPGPKTKRWARQSTGDAVMPLYSFHCAKCDEGCRAADRLFRHARLSNLRQPRSWSAWCLARRRKARAVASMKSARAQAAREGHLSNFSRFERRR